LWRAEDILFEDSCHMDIATIIIFLVAWILLQNFVLPRLGVPT